MPNKVSMAFILLFAIALVFGLLAFIYYSPDSGDLTRTDYGVLGDYFGGILNPAFAFLSFLALLGTISLQVKELEAQREELRMTRNEMRESKLAQERSATELKLQNQLQVHSVRTSALSSLIKAASFEAEYAATPEAQRESLDEIEVYARQLEAEVEAVTSLIPEATQRVREAERGLFGFITQ